MHSRMEISHRVEETKKESIKEINKENVSSATSATNVWNV